MTLAEDTLATEQKDIQQRIDDAEDKAIDLAWYRMWVNNPGVLNLSFLGKETEATLKRWSAKLEEEDELDTVVEAVDSNEEEEVDSLLKTATSRLEAIRKDAAPSNEPNIVPTTAETAQPGVEPDVPSEDATQP